VDLEIALSVISPTAVRKCPGSASCMKTGMRANPRRNRCRRKGVQVGTVDALIAQLCIRHELRLLTNDLDFTRVAKHVPLVLLAG
jgi:hypothetical protein